MLMAGKIEKEGLKVTEADLQRAVIQRARLFGWKVMHPLPAQTSRGSGWATATQGDGRGYPDLTLVRERIVFAELKAEGKYLGEGQKLWRDWILAAEGEWYCWKPSQWFDGTIDRVLGALHPYRPVDETILDTDRYKRLLQACGGNEESARRVYHTVTQWETASPK